MVAPQVGVLRLFSSQSSIDCHLRAAAVDLFRPSQVKTQHSLQDGLHSFAEHSRVRVACRVGLGCR
jgi:hypothetical protein